MKRFISIFVMALHAGYVPVHLASTTTNVPPTATAIAIEKTTALEVTTENTIIPEATVTIAPQATTATVRSETGLGWLAFLEHGRITVLRLTEEDGSLLQIFEGLSALEGHPGGMTALQFSSDGCYLASGGGDGVVVV